MVKVKLKQRDPEDLEKVKEVEIYLDGYIKANLDLGVEQLHDDFDQVWFIDGGEGEGKSDLGAQYAYYVSPEESRHTLLDRICLTAEDFDEVILNAKKYDSIVLDESFGGMSATGSMARINRVLQRRFTEIRAKNLFIFIVAPSFMDIMRYFAIWRSKCLLHVYLSKERKRGFAAFYGEKKKRKLYILGKKNFYNYQVVAPQFTFRFIKQLHLVVDKELYDKKKGEVTTRTPQDEREEKMKIRKRVIVAFAIEKLWQKGIGLKTAQLSEIFNYSERYIQEITKELKDRGVFPNKYINILTN